MLKKRQKEYVTKKGVWWPTKPKIFMTWPFTESMLTPGNVTKETRQVSEENTGEPRKGEIFPNDSKSRSKRENDW